MIWEERARSERQRAQRRCEAWPERKDSASGGEVELAVEETVREEIVLSMLDWRRRKGLEGTR